MSKSRGTTNSSGESGDLIMKRRTLILLTTFEAAFVLVAVYFEPSCCVRGHLRGEAFYDGKSTTWWRGELERWEIRNKWRWGAAPHYTRIPTWLDGWRNRWQALLRADDGPHWEKLGETLGPKLLRGDPEADRVLRELLDDPAPKVRNLARTGLNMQLELE
jgi:hypothetical protein